MDAQDGGSNLLFILIGVFIVYTLIKQSERTEADLMHIPTFGYQGYLLSYVDAFKFVFKGPVLLCAAYEKHKPGVFKIATLYEWLVVLTGTQHIEGLRVIPEENLYGYAHKTVSQLHYSSHFPSRFNETIIRYMTQCMPFMVSDLREGVINVLKELPQCSSEWTETYPVDLVLHLMTTVNNRFFFGLSSTHDSNFSALSLLVAKYCFLEQYSLVSQIFPCFNSSVLSFFGQSSRNKRRLCKLFASILNDRVDRKPQPQTNRDMLSWVITCGREDSLASDIFEYYRLTTDSLLVNFLHVLYYLTANPKYATPMRKEIEAITSKDGWTKASLDKMHKLDSFVKESLRLSCMMSVNTIREIRDDITLSDGTRIPSRTVVCVASLPRHLDRKTYGSELTPPTSFVGFRFSNRCEQSVEEYIDPPRRWPETPPSYSTSGRVVNADGHRQTGSRCQLVTTTPDYLAWGYGAHACPGRFYASLVMKLALAQMVMRYDLRFEDGCRPRDVCLGLKTLPSLKARILLRKREK